MMDALLLIARIALFGVFAVAGIGKSADLAGSRQAMRDFGLPESLAKPAGLALPILELIVALLLLPVATAAWGALGAFVLLVAFVAGISVNLARGKTPDCHCFGQIHSAPAGRSTLIRNGILALVALLIAVPAFGGEAGASVLGWTGELSGLSWVVLIGGLVMVAVLGAMVWLLTHLLGQNGRLLVRLDAVEAALRGNDLLPAEAEEEEEVEGIAIGTPAPAFALASLQGETTSLDSLKAVGKPVLLVFSDPGCGPCNALLPDIGRWQKEHTDRLTVAVITRGGAEANQCKASEHGLTHVLIQDDWEVAEAYESNGTPSGVVIRADGTIGSVVVPGGEAIRTLMKQALSGKLPDRVPRPKARPAAPRKAAEQPAMNIGKPAPAFELSDLQGTSVSLQDFQGQPTAVLFWNPGCGFCQRMLDDLKAWEADRSADAPRLLVVSTGETAENSALGLSSPVVLDQGFSTGRAFGASGTPSAVLVDAEGKIGSAIAVGAPSVLGLLRGEAPAPVGGNGAAEPEVPNSPKIGETAPELKLPDLDGRTIDLADHQGTRTMVLFWNPGCGFCQRMIDDLKAWEHKPPKGAPKLLVVSSGSVDETRAIGFRSPVVLDPSFSAGTSFGADGTPAAIIIDARGKVASALALGAPAVMELARSRSDQKSKSATV